MGGKICKKCKQYKSYDDYHYHCDRKDGYRDQCKNCNILENRLRARKRKENWLQSGIDPTLKSDKKCTNCTLHKSGKDFHRDLETADGLSFICKSCTKVKKALNIRNNPEKYMFDNAKRRAMKQGIEFSITLSDIKIPRFCPVLGISLQIGNEKMNSNSPSLDKINPNLGYTKGNIRVISWKANRIKSDASISEIEKILEYMKSTKE